MKHLILAIAFLFVSLCSKAQTSAFQFYFDSGKSKLAPFEGMAFKKQFPTNTIDSVQIFGFTDSVGSITSNETLSQARAKAIQSFMKELGLKKNQITIVKGLGENKETKDSLHQDLLLDRKVDITVYLKQPEVEKPKELVEEKKVVKSTKKKKVKSVFSAEQMEVGKKIVIPNLNFYGNSHRLLPESADKLDDLIAVLKKNTSMKIKIIGHVCCTVGNQVDARDDDNGEINLSFQRAFTIREKLIEAGIEESRLVPEGKGGSQKLFPLERNSKEWEANRRVEIEVISL
jgi:outer membrane protein OmpA-like peptidoglycan-associated protein